MNFNITMINMPNKINNGQLFKELPSIKKHMTALELKTTLAEQYQAMDPRSSVNLKQSKYKEDSSGYIITNLLKTEKEKEVSLQMGNKINS